MKKITINQLKAIITATQTNKSTKSTKISLFKMCSKTMMKRKGVASWKVISNRKSNKMPVISIMKAIQLIDSLFV